MGEWDFIGKHFETLANHSPMLGRLWLFFMVVFRIVILGTVADDTFSDEQEEFTCNTLQPGCKQVCFSMAFPISMYRFWVFQIVVIATPSLLFLLYATHHYNKRKDHLKKCNLSTENLKKEKRFKVLYIVNLLFRIGAEVGFLVGQWKLYGFDVKEQFECERFPCPKIVDCFTSRPAEKTIFLHFYFSAGVLSAIISFLELCYFCIKWENDPPEPHARESCSCSKLIDSTQEEQDNSRNKQKEAVKKTDSNTYRSDLQV